jgi:hypothetical protein
MKRALIVVLALPAMFVVDLDVGHIAYPHLIFAILWATGAVVAIAGITSY